MTSLLNQTVLVIGGSSGLGLATARAAAGSGARVPIASRDDRRRLPAVASIGHDATGRPVDITDDRSVQEFFATGETWDHVVVSAAATRIGPIATMPPADAYDAVNSKFWGAVRVARHAPIRAGGSLTLVAGYLATRPAPGRALQSAINAALEGLTRGLALELKPVRVNAVSPGTIDTPLWQSMPDADRAAMFERVAAALPAGRIGQPEDIAGQIVLFMATPFATGTVVTIDGGASIA
ncbi:MAG: SDR family oxidoreductase [Telmatospirillum sp.]|nr:SDR family oxidoreductase [Telmatospirillum sp.]